MLHYLKAIIYHGLHLKRDSHLKIQAFSDVDWLALHLSMTLILFLGAPRNNRLSLVRPQKWSTEVVAFTASELAWVQALLYELNQCPSSTPTIVCDNIGTICLCRSCLSQSIEAVSIDFHFVNVSIAKGQLRVVRVSMKDHWQMH